MKEGIKKGKNKGKKEIIDWEKDRKKKERKCDTKIVGYLQKRNQIHTECIKTKIYTFSHNTTHSSKFNTKPYSTVFFTLVCILSISQNSKSWNESKAQEMRTIE